MTKDQLKIVYRLVRDRYITEDEFIIFMVNDKIDYYKIPYYKSPVWSNVNTTDVSGIQPNYIFEGDGC